MTWLLLFVLSGVLTTAGLMAAFIRTWGRNHQHRERPTEWDNGPVCPEHGKKWKMGTGAVVWYCPRCLWG